MRALGAIGKSAFGFQQLDGTNVLAKSRFRRRGMRAKNSQPLKPRQRFALAVRCECDVAIWFHQSAIQRGRGRRLQYDGFVMKFTPGPLAGQLSGKIGNTVASHSRTGPYFRLKAIPVNPQTDFQLDIRAQLASLAQGWRSLTPTEQASWTSVGQDIHRSDSLGQDYTLTGEQAYIANNMNRLIFGVAVVDTAPLLDSPVVLTSWTLNLWEEADKAVEFTPTPLGAAARLKIFATRGLSAGVLVPGRGEFRLINATAANVASPYSVTALYSAKFGPGVVGQKMFIRGVSVSANFWDGIPQSTNAILS